MLLYVPIETSVIPMSSYIRNIMGFHYNVFLLNVALCPMSTERQLMLIFTYIRTFMNSWNMPTCIRIFFESEVIYPNEDKLGK